MNDSPEQILSDLLAIPFFLQRAGARRGSSEANDPPKRVHVFQDGANFYQEFDIIVHSSPLDDGLGGGRLLASFPYRVADYDMRSAKTARRWFVETWCPQNDIEPIWEPE